MAVRAPDIRQLAEEMGCGVTFAHDLVILAGGDLDLVREASRTCDGANQMKAYIIDRRFRKIEER